LGHLLLLQACEEIIIFVVVIIIAKASSLIFVLVTNGLDVVEVLGESLSFGLLEFL